MLGVVVGAEQSWVSFGSAVVPPPEPLDDELALAEDDAGPPLELVTSDPDELFEVSTGSGSELHAT